MSIPVVEGKRFRLGKYEVVGQPIPQSAHMLRYTVFVDGIRIGALASVPTESDCRFLEHPPAVPPLKIYSVIYRPGRPKKGTVRPTDKAVTPPILELPHEIELPRSRDSE